MRILVVSQYYYPEPFRINEICEAFVSHGNKVTVVTGLPNYPEGKLYTGYESLEMTETINGVSVIRCLNRPRKRGVINLVLNYLSFLVQSLKTIRKLRSTYDIVYGYQLSPITSVFAASVYAKRANIPFFLYCLDVWPASAEEFIGERGLLHFFAKRIATRIYKSAQIIGVTSPCFIEYISNLINKENIIYLPQHALPLQENNCEKEKREENGRINILFTGNIGISQNIGGILHSLKLLEKDDLGRVLFHVVGNGSAFEQIKEDCKKLSLQDNVIFYGRKEKTQLSKYYDLADVCIVPLKKEGIVGNTIPGKLQEYMSAGKAIISFLDGDASLIVNEAHCGIAIPAEDINGLANAISFLIHHPAMIEAWGKNAKQYYDNNFTLTQHITVLEREMKEQINIYKKDYNEGRVD